MSAYISLKVTSAERARWLRIREGGIGASEAAAMMGEGRWLSAAQLWARKVRGEESTAGEAAEWGLRLEDAIRDAYSSDRYAGRASEADQRLVRSAAHPWAICTLDAWTEHPEHGRIPLELKTTNEYLADDWQDGPPPYYLWQVQHQMLVTGAPVASVACLIGGQQLVWDDVERDEEMIARLARVGSRFWESIRHARATGDVTPPDWLQLDSPAVKMLWPDGDGAEVELGTNFAELDAERQELKDEEKRVKARLVEIDDELRVAIGGATYGKLAGGVRYSFKEQARRGYTVQPSTSRVLRRHAPRKKREAA